MRTGTMLSDCCKSPFRMVRIRRNPHITKLVENSSIQFRVTFRLFCQNFGFIASWQSQLKLVERFKLLGKTFSKGTTSDFPLQFTFVWGMQDIFGVKGLRFSGFADLWGENVVAFAEDPNSEKFLKKAKFQFLSEPQLWYNIGRHFGVDNLNIGGEVEFSYNFAGYDGFYVRPCIGTKWVF